MKQILLLFTILLTSQFTAFSQDVLSRVVGASPFQDSLWVVDTTNYTVSYRTAPTPSSGGAITGITGMAKRPSTGQIYTINKQSGTSGRTLGIIDLNTSIVTIVGNLGDNFSSITFRGDSLFGVTGDGAAVPETVYLINPADASKVLYRALGNGADGEVICYNPSDDMIYHWSGNGTIVFEKFSPLLPGDPVVNIPIIGTTNGETFGAAYMGNNKFLGSNISSSFNRWNADGTVSPPAGANPDDLRGLVFSTCVRQITGSTGFCTGSSTTLTMSSGMSYQWYKDGAPLSGATNAALVVSVEGVYNCIVQDICGTDSVSVGVIVEENPLPNVSLSGSSVFCTGSTTTLTGSSGGTSQWYLNGVAISGETSNTIAVGAPGVYNMTKTNLNGCTDSSAVGIIISEAPLPTVTLDAAQYTVCQDAGMVSLTESPVGGVFTGSTGNSFDPSALAAGMYDVIYTYTDTNSCTAADTITIEVYQAASAILTPVNSDVCVDGPVTVLGGSPVGGTYVPSDIVNPGQLGVGSFVYQYIYEDVNGCIDTAEALVNVLALPTVDLDAPVSDACVYDGPITLTGTPSGGTYSGTGVTGNSFDPSTADLGNNALDYTFTDQFGCTNVSSINIAVDSCLSINENESIAVSMYPNPANTELTVQATTNISAIAVLDMTGKTVNVPVVVQQTFGSLSLQSVANGTYWVVITLDEGTRIEKLVVAH